MTRHFRILGIFALLLGASQTRAVEIPSSALENYRLESQYGPSDALLAPIYDRDSRLEASVGGAFSPLSSLGKYQAVTGSVIYNINRRHSVEPIFYSFHNTQLSSFVKNQIADKLNSSFDDLTVEIPKQVFLASYYFTPYHSKLHLTTQSVLHFDIYFGAGAGAIQLVPTDLTGSKAKTSWSALVSANAGMRFLFGSQYFTKLDFKNLIYTSKDFGDSSRKNDLQIGLALGLLL
jgi:outer membrane beta-barrel protein